MLTQEVLVEAPGRPGTLGRVFSALARAGVETLGVATQTYLEDGRRWRRVRLLFRDQTEGAAALKHEGLSVRVQDVVYLQAEASVARLDWALDRLAAAGIEVDTLYHGYAPGGPGLVLVVDNPAKAAELL